MDIRIFDKYTLKDSLGDKSFDLYKDRIAKNKKTGEKYLTEDNIAWGVTIERAIDIMVQDTMKEEDVLFLNDFLREYNKANKEFIQEIEDRLKTRL